VLLVYFSEFLNELGARNWQRFSKQQYFDSNGLFISVVFSSPILLNCIFLLARFLHQSFDLMTKVKTAQLRQQLKNRRDADKSVPASHAKED
jgi:transmembrane protein 18